MRILNTVLNLFSQRFPLIDRVVVQGAFLPTRALHGEIPRSTGDPTNFQADFLWSAALAFRFNFLYFAGAIMRIDLARTIHPDEGLGLSSGGSVFLTRLKCNLELTPSTLPVIALTQFCFPRYP